MLLISSGGLSDYPPVPRLATATPAQRAMLDGREPAAPAEARAARQQRVIDAARDFAAGTADIQDLAPEWDRELLRILASGRPSPVDAFDPDEMTRIAGNSSHEVRTWIAGYAAMAAVGTYEVQHSYYRPIRELIAGFAMTTVVHTEPSTLGHHARLLLRLCTPHPRRTAGAGVPPPRVRTIESEGDNVVEMPVRRTGQRLGTVVLDELKERLLSGQYPAGSRISIEEVKAEFGVSKQPVMDAMRRLEAIGIVQIVPQSGCRVASYTAQEVLDFFNLFGRFEGEVAAAAATRRTDAQLDELDATWQRIADLEHTTDTTARSRGYRFLNREFHLVIHHMAHSRVMAELQRTHVGHERLLHQHHRGAQHLSDAVTHRNHDHDVIRSAIRSRNGEVAGVAMQSHIVETVALFRDDLDKPA